MSPVIFSCVLCGYVILDIDRPESSSWSNQFRALYSSPSGVAISGVGVYNDPNEGEWIAPSDPAARWDDEGYDFPDHDRIGVIWQSPRNGRYGFPFHESCWCLLEKVSSPRKIDYKALFDVCRSLPFPPEGTSLNWGCDFDGLLIVDDEHRYPWEERFDVPEEYSPHVMVDPYCVPELQQLPSGAPGVPPVLSLSDPTTTATNCFQALPLEICIAIASYLPTVDALNARQLSRSFLAIFYSQQFWASRFTRDGDRAWLFESEQWSRASDWRWLYHATNKSNRTSGMHNRERVWKLAQKVQRVLGTRRSALPSLPAPTPNPGPGTPIWKWHEVTGDLQADGSLGPYHHFDEGCKLFHEQQVSIPNCLSGVMCSMVQLGDAEYIAGVRFVPKQGEALQLGYRTENEQVAMNVTSITGLMLAVGSRGVQGIQCVLEGGRTSEWIGSHDQSPQTRRLVTFAPVMAVRAGFDGCKMVSMAVAESVPHSVTEQTSSRSLRDSAFWYPRVPEANLCLNDEFFISRDNSSTRYEPLCWTMFGGPGGKYLRNLTGISVTCWGAPSAIDFQFDNEDVPSECRRVGKFKPFEFAEVIYFPIDGPGGEIIETVEVYFRTTTDEPAGWFYKLGALKSFKISTNRGRSCHFAQKWNLITEGSAQKSITFSTNTTLTGFYWCQHWNRITALGTISEILAQND